MPQAQGKGKGYQEVVVGDTIYEFPAGMPDEQIQAALAKLPATPAQPAPRDGRGVVSGLLQSLAGASPEASREGVISGLASGAAGAAQLGGEVLRGEMAVGASPGLQAARTLGGPVLGLLASPAIRQVGAGLVGRQAEQLALAKEALARVFKPRAGAPGRAAEAVTGVAEAGLRGVAGLLPLVGPMAAESADQMAQGLTSGDTGEFREGLGKGVGTVVSALTMGRKPIRPISPGKAAGRFLQSVGEGMSPGVGKAITLQLEKFAESSFPGETRMLAFRKAQQASIARVADSILGKLHPQAVDAGTLGREVAAELDSVKTMLTSVAQRGQSHTARNAALAMLKDFEREALKKVAKNATAAQFEKIPVLLTTANPDDITALLSHLPATKVDQLRRSVVQDLLSASTETTMLTGLKFLSGRKGQRLMAGNPLTRSTLGPDRFAAIFKGQEANLRDLKKFLREVEPIRPGGQSRGTAVNLGLVMAMISGTAMGSAPVAATAGGMIGGMWTLAQVLSRPQGARTMVNVVRALKAGNKTQAAFYSTKAGELYREGLQQALAAGEPVPPELQQ